MMQSERNQTAPRHRRACSAFSAVVVQGVGRWSAPSPCPGWDARDVVEHVIAIHDELLLGPAGVEPHRPDDDPPARWAATVVAIDAATGASTDASTDGSSDGSAAAAAGVDLDTWLPILTGEIVAHTWDLAEALGVDADLDPELCEIALATVQANEQQVRASGLVGPPVPAPAGSDVLTQFVSFLGRRPGAVPPSESRS